MNNINDYKIEYGSKEWYLYHAWENEKPVIPLILLSCFLLICRGGELIIFLVWWKYFSWAHNNNKKLNCDPEILRQREAMKKYRNKFNS